MEQIIFHWKQGPIYPAVYTMVADYLVMPLTHWPLGNLNEILDMLFSNGFLVISGWGISCEIALIWMLLDLTDDQSTLVQIIAWCCQATSHYLSQCLPLSPYAVTRPQWVKANFHWLTWSSVWYETKCVTGNKNFLQPCCPCIYFSLAFLDCTCFFIVLPLNMVNCFIDYKRHIHISYHILDFVQQEKKNYNTAILGASSKVLVLGTWYLMQNLRVLGTYLYLTLWNSKVLGTYLYLMQSTWYLSKYFQVLMSN